jgi:molybdenum-dependent DNA-binding transcriptional regulator ModE
VLACDGCDSFKRLPLKRAAFLAALRKCGTISAAAEAAGIDRTTHYRWLEDSKYADQFAEAQQDAGESL